MADFNSMQGSLGLGAGQFDAPQPVATQPVAIPPTRHPGEMSAMLAQSAQMASVQVRQATSFATPGAVPGIFNPSMTNMGGVMMPGATPLSAFAAQFAGNAASIRGGAMPAYAPGSYGGFGGFGPVPGFNAGMMPSAAFMGDPSLGMYRTSSYGAMNYSYPPLAREPLFRSPIYQPLPPPLFGTHMSQALDITATQSAQAQGMLAAGVGVATRGLLGGTGYFLGSRLGAAAGSMFGPMGAGVGALVGGVGGMLGTDNFLGQAAGQFASTNIISSTAQRAAQLQGITNGFVVSGPNLGLSGRGVSTADSLQLQRFVNDAGYANNLGFNPSDLTRIMNTAGKAGLMDMSQSVGDMKNRVTQLARTLKQFMQVAEEPDVVNAIREIGNMRSMGLSMNEAMGAARNVRMFARMAGTTMAGLSEYGQAGALTYQSNGLSGGLGMNVGAGAIAMARQMVNSGTFTDQQLATLGGVAGLAQRQMESSAAFLKVPMVAASVSRLGANGGFTLDPDLVAKLASGQMDVRGMALNASNNLTNAVAKGGVSALGSYFASQDDLQDQLGRAMGPVGIQMAMMRQAHNTMGMLGLKGPGGFGLAAMAQFRDPQLARYMMQAASNPEFFANMQRQLGVTAAEEGAERTAYERNREDRYLSDMDRYMNRYTDPLGRIGSNISAGVRSLSRNVSELSEDFSARRRGLYVARLDSGLLAETDLERSNVRKFGAVTAGNRIAPLDAALNGAPGQSLFGPNNMMRYVYEREGKTGMQLYRSMLSPNADPDLQQRFEQQQGGAVYSQRIMSATVQSAGEARAALEASMGKPAAAAALDRIARDLTAAGDAKRATSTIGGSASAGALVGGIAAMRGGPVVGLLGSVAGAGLGALGHGMFGTNHRALTKDDIEGAVRRSMPGASQEDINRAVDAVSIRARAAGMNPNAFGTDTGKGASKADAFARANKAAGNIYTNVGNVLTGGARGFTQEQHRDYQKLMFAGASNEHVGAVASLMLAMQNADPAQAKAARDAYYDYLRQLDIDGVNSEKVVHEAEQAVKMAGDRGLTDYGKTVGVALSGMGTQGIKTRAASTRNTDLAMLRTIQDNAGANALSETTNQGFGKVQGVDDLISKVKGMGGASKLADKTAADKYVRQAMETYEKEVSAAGNSVAGVTAAKDRLSDTLNAYSPVSASSLESGHQSDRANGLRANVASFDMTMRSVFPQAVGTFKEAAEKLNEAAEKMTKATFLPLPFL